MLEQTIVVQPTTGRIRAAEIARRLQVRAAATYYLLGIECDGATYHRAATARDRDKLRQLILEGLGWKLHRIWSTDWWHDANKEMERLLGEVKKIQGG